MLEVKAFLRLVRGRSSSSSNRSSSKSDDDQPSAISRDSTSSASSSMVVTTSTIVFNVKELRDHIFTFHAINLLKRHVELVKIPVTPLALWRAHVYLWDEDFVRFQQLQRLLCRRWLSKPPRGRRAIKEAREQARQLAEEQSRQPSVLKIRIGPEWIEPEWPSFTVGYVRAARIAYNEVLAFPREIKMYDPYVRDIEEYDPFVPLRGSGSYCRRVQLQWETDVKNEMFNTLKRLVYRTQPARR